MFLRVVGTLRVPLTTLKTREDGTRRVTATLKNN